jgi:hypothetical protein
MTRTIKTAQEGFLEESLDFVEKVFTESEDAESGKMMLYFNERFSQELGVMI